MVVVWRLSRIFLASVTQFRTKHIINNLHFNSLDLDPPGIRGLVPRDLHVVGYWLSFWQNITQALSTQHISITQSKIIVLVLWIFRFKIMNFIRCRYMVCELAVNIAIKCKSWMLFESFKKLMGLSLKKNNRFLSQDSK